MSFSIVVVKFGSSVLRSRADLPTAVHEVYRWYRAGNGVLVVVSAIGDATDMLLTSARALAAGDPGTLITDAIPEPNATAALLATGECASAALLGVALDRAGIPARVVDPYEIHLEVHGTPLDSEPVSVDITRLHALFSDAPVLIVPGFFGIGPDGRRHLLGRGGSDLTAVFLAHAIDASRCRLIKDVDGVYERDPAPPQILLRSTRPRQAASDDSPRRFAQLTYAEAIGRAAPLVQPKAIHFLQRYHRIAEVAAIGRQYASVVGPTESRFCSLSTRPPLRVALMGLGTVGFGVYQRLAAMSTDFEIAGILIRNRAAHESRGAPKHLLYTDPDVFLADARNPQRRVDVVVDALCGFQPSNRLIESFLHADISVVTANKGLVATSGPRLVALPCVQREGEVRPPCEFLYSAAVGGSAPMIEALRRASRNAGETIRSISAVLNGTCNFILSRAAEGSTFQKAVLKARELGFAEADPSDDLSGRDAARKLRILVRHAFGRDVDPDLMDVEPIDVTAFPRARQARNAGKVLRLVASAEFNVSRNDQDQRRFTTRIRLEALDPDHPLANVPAEWNRLVINQANCPAIIVSGRGAGRWPTTEAVIADLWELKRNGARTEAGLAY